MLGASSLVLVFVNVQNQFLGMHGSLANGVNYRTVHRRMGSETEELFLGCRLGISSN